MIKYILTKLKNILMYRLILIAFLSLSSILVALPIYIPAWKDAEFFICVSFVLIACLLLLVQILISWINTFKERSVKSVINTILSTIFLPVIMSGVLVVDFKLLMAEQYLQQFYTFHKSYTVKGDSFYIYTKNCFYNQTDCECKKVSSVFIKTKFTPFMSINEYTEAEVISMKEIDGRVVALFNEQCTNIKQTIIVI